MEEKTYCITFVIYKNYERNIRIQHINAPSLMMAAHYLLTKSEHKNHIEELISINLITNDYES